jgi:hypothetical protein
VRLALLVGLPLGVLVLWIAAQAWTFGQDIRSAQSHLRLAQATFDLSRPGNLTRSNLEHTKGELYLAERSLRSASGRLDGIGWLLSPLGHVWPQLTSGRRLLAAGADFSAAAQFLTDGLAPAVDALAQQPPGSSTPEVMSAALQAGAPSIQKALRIMSPAEEQVASIPPGSLDFLGSRVSSLPDQMQTVFAGVQALIWIPDFVGSGATKRYLVAAENPADLRATGGYLGSWGVVTLTNGRIASLDYHGFTAWPGAGSGHLTSGFQPGNFRPPPGWDVYEEAPGRFVQRDGWWAQDANWYPDFPTSARVMEAFWDKGETPVDGVIALDTYAMQDLLRAVGPLTLPDYSETVTADNVIERAEVYEGRGPDLTRPASEQQDKTFLATLATALLTRLRASNPSELVRVGAALQQATRERHLFLSVHDPALADILQDQGWDGSVSQAPGDYVMLVDQNTLFTKIASHVQRKVDYAVQFNTDLSATAELTVTYTNGQRAIDPRIGFTSDFGDYARLYVPLGSTLQSSQGFDETPRAFTESGHTVFGGLVYVPMGQSRTLMLRYSLPAGILAGASGPVYRLLVQKQAGLDEVPFQARVAFPSGTALSVLGPAGGLTLSGNSASFAGTLRADRSIQLSLAGGPLAASAHGQPSPLGTAQFEGDRWDVVRQIPEVAAILDADRAPDRPK